MRRILIASTLLLSCGAANAQSQSSLDAYAASIMGQVQSDGDPECGMNGNGNCVPVTLKPSDVTPVSGTTVIDKFGNKWGLQLNPQGESGAGNWYGNVTVNGQLLPGNDHNGGLSYAAAIRLGPDGLVYIQRSKGAGWQVEDPNNIQQYNYNTWSYVTPPDSGAANDTATLATDTSGPQSASANDPASTTVAPLSAPASIDPAACAGASIGPGRGSIADASGNTFTVDPSTGDQVMVNGQAATPNGEGSQTSAVTQVSGQIYGQDETTRQWFLLVQDPSRPYWQPVSQAPQDTSQTSPDPAATNTHTAPLDMGIVAQCQAQVQRLRAAQGEASALAAKLGAMQSSAGN